MPVWYEDAKLGVFLHWGLYSVPGWAPRVPDIQELLVKSGPKRMLWENPYAEWYLNSMQIKGSPTQVHHAQVYGDDYPYENFVKTFNDASVGANLDAVADLCQAAGARYVVLTTKHHEGFALWPSAVPHPVKGQYHASRDLVGDLSEAVRAKRIRMGLYYSGGYDWPYNNAVLSKPADAVLAVPHGRRYVEYVTAQWRELIDRYQPSVLWNDISWPSGGNLADLFAYYYNTVEEGVINDRWVEPNLPRNTFTDGLVRGAGSLLQLLWRFIPDRRKRLTFSTPKHCDFRTPEYDVLHTVSERKWELARGVGHSFGANRHELAQDIISDTELIQMFCDVVSKNGNLLIGVGPRPDGTIPELQQAPLQRARRLAGLQRRGHLRQPPVGDYGVGHDRRNPAALHQERRGCVRTRDGDARLAAGHHAGRRRVAGPASTAGGGRRAARVLRRQRRAHGDPARAAAPEGRDRAGPRYRGEGTTGAGQVGRPPTFGTFGGTIGPVTPGLPVATSR